jgi:geranylgeranyl pyrophosphate synthase
MISTAQKMFSGELDQLMNNSVYISRKEYFRIISQKTGSFFSACCSMPALLSNANSLQGSALFMYGRNLGIAFQITDDVLDIIGDEKKFGKKRGSDIKQGFLTLPLVHFYEKASCAEKKTLLDVLTRKRQNLKEIVKLLARYRSIEYAQDRAKSYSKKAKRSIGIFPDSAAKNSLIRLCDFVVARDH